MLFTISWTDLRCCEFRGKGIHVSVLGNMLCHITKKCPLKKSFSLFLQFITDLTLIMSFGLCSNLNNGYDRHYYHNLYIYKRCPLKSSTRRPGVGLFAMHGLTTRGQCDWRKAPAGSLQAPIVPDCQPGLGPLPVLEFCALGL